MARGRNLARICAVQALYQWRATGQTAAEIQPNFIDNRKLTGPPRAYFQTLVAAIPADIAAIDALIKPHLDREPDKLDWVEQAIIRVGTYELAHQPDIPTNVVLNEAIDIAKSLCAAHGYKFVNAVLDKIAHAVRNQPTAAD